MGNWSHPINFQTHICNYHNYTAPANTSWVYSLLTSKGFLRVWNFDISERFTTDLDIFTFSAHKIFEEAGA